MDYLTDTGRKGKTQVNTDRQTDTGATTLSITTVRITTFKPKDTHMKHSAKVIVSINDTQHNNALPLC